MSTWWEIRVPVITSVRFGFPRVRLSRHERGLMNDRIQHAERETEICYFLMCIMLLTDCKDQRSKIMKNRYELHTHCCALHVMCFVRSVFINDESMPMSFPLIRRCWLTHHERLITSGRECDITHSFVRIKMSSWSELVALMTSSHVRVSLQMNLSQRDDTFIEPLTSEWSEVCKGHEFPRSIVLIWWNCWTMIFKL